MNVPAYRRPALAVRVLAGVCALLLIAVLGLSWRLMGRDAGAGSVGSGATESSAGGAAGQLITGAGEGQFEFSGTSALADRPVTVRWLASPAICATPGSSS